MNGRTAKEEPMSRIFITGSSTGLGRATAKLFASKGWDVVATMRDPEKSADVAAIPKVTVLALDITRPEQIQAVVKQVIEAGPVDVVFNNAGYAVAGPLEATTDDQIVREINTNFLGVVRTTQAFIPHFRERKAGLFINTSSI